MIFVVALLTAVLLCCSGAAQGQRTCPWLTEGMANTVLGGPSVPDVSSVSETEGTCIFKLQQGPVLSVREIFVTTAPLSDCPPDSAKLAGVGNQAMLCTVSRRPGEVRYIVDGVVRSVFFRTSLSIQGAQAARRTTEEQQQSLERIAEQVAGSLF